MSYPQSRMEMRSERTAAPDSRSTARITSGLSVCLEAVLRALHESRRKQAGIVLARHRRPIAS